MIGINDVNRFKKAHNEFSIEHLRNSDKAKLAKNTRDQKLIKLIYNEKDDKLKYYFALKSKYM